VIQLAESLGIRFPTIFQIVSVEVENPYEILEGLSQPVETALPAIVERVRRIVHGWLFDSSPPS
jgi:Ni,Fe-hydrogenase maturation factor